MYTVHGYKRISISIATAENGEHSLSSSHFLLCICLFSLPWSVREYQIPPVVSWMK